MGEAALSEERMAKEKLLGDLEKERKRADDEEKRADTLQDTLVRQSGNTNKIPLTTYQLIHKPDDVTPCMQKSTSRAEGTFCMCTVKDHWYFDEEDTIFVEPTDEEIDD